MSESCTNVVIEQHALSPEERAVLEAAENVERLWRTVEFAISNDKGGDEFRAGVMAMNRTIDALRASRHPAGVDPATVAPGTQFRFVPGPGEGGTGLCDLYALGSRRFWSMHGDAELYDFREGVRIIPIPEDQ